MSWVIPRRLQRRLTIWALCCGLVWACLLCPASVAAAELTPRSVLLSDARPGAVATFQLSFAIPAPETLGSIKLQFCSNDPLLADSCTVPAGFDISGATLSAQSGEIGFGVDGSTTANTLILSRAPLLAGAGAVSYTLDGVVNPSSAGSLYGRLQTFATNDASGPENEHGGLAMSINNSFEVTTEVPPYLLFCGAVTIGGLDCGNASGSYINFGNLSTGSTASATSQLLTASNAGSGFAVSVYGLTMTSGNNTIAAMNPADVSRPGLAQFGLNVVANTTPAIGSDPTGPGAEAPVAPYGTSDFFHYVSGDAVASVATADDYKKLTVSYIINIPLAQPVGVYVTTLTYVCLANF